VLVDLVLLAGGVGAGGWLATRWDEFDPPERWGNLLLVAALALSGGAGLAELSGQASLAGQGLAGLAALGGFYLLVVQGSGVPRPPATEDPADVPEELEDADRDR
jgi:hypothetical protein